MDRNRKAEGDCGGVASGHGLITTLGPRTNNARHGDSAYGPVVMDRPERNRAGTAWARLRVGEREAVLWLGDREWCGLMDMLGGMRIVCVDPETWVVKWRD